MMPEGVQNKNNRLSWTDASVAKIVVCNVGACSFFAKMKINFRPLLERRSECPIGNCKIKHMFTAHDQGAGTRPTEIVMPVYITTIIAITATAKIA
jgi:hypothetical protein